MCVCVPCEHMCLCGCFCVSLHPYALKCGCYVYIRYASLKSSRIVTKFYRITIVFASYYDRIRVVLRSYLGRITIVFRSNYDRKLDLVRP